MRMLAVICMMLFGASAIMGADKPKSPKQAAESLPRIKPPARFEQLKQLVGKWEGTEAAPGEKKKIAVEYALTSAGTVLMEKLFPGKPHEMLSLYHGDKGRILMTHYCALGNQPRMKLAKSDDPNVLKFVFLDGTNMKSLKDPHMHQLTLTLSGKDKLTHEWVFFEDGKKQKIVRFEFSRQK